MAIRITYFVHGTTTDNENGLATGWLPGKLSALGKKQAQELGQLVADKQFDVVFCSDLKRAVDSARLAFGNKYEILPDRRLRECNYGDFNGKPVAEFKKDMTKHIREPFLNGESYKQVEERMADFYNSLDLFVFPTKIEGYGLPIVEAFACKKPVIVLGDAIMTDEIKSRCTQVDNLTDFLKSPKSTQDIEANYAFAKTHDWNICVEEYIKLYQRVLECK